MEPIASVSALRSRLYSGSIRALEETRTRNSDRLAIQLSSIIVIMFLLIRKCIRHNYYTRKNLLNKNSTKKRTNKIIIKIK